MQVIQAEQTFAQMFAAAFGVPHEQDPFGLDPDEMVEPAETIALESEANHAPSRELTLGEQYRDIFRRYCQAVDAWAAALHVVGNDERALVDSIKFRSWYAIETLADFKVADMKESAAKEIRKRLVHLAMEVFAPPGGKLEIDDYAIGQQFPVSSDAPESFDPAPVWEYLEAAYGGEAGQRLAWEQVAQAFKSQFFGRYRESPPEVVMKGGYVVLEVRVWLDDFDKKMGKARLSYSAADGIRHKCNALADIAAWAEREQLARDLQRFPQEVDRFSTEIVSRKQYPLGENGEMVVVTYQSKFEFKLRQDFAEQLQIFLGTYGEDT